MLRYVNLGLFGVLRSRSAITSIEYALLGAGIFLVIISATALLGTDLSNVFANMTARLLAAQG